jgi:hypothetical protein
VHRELDGAAQPQPPRRLGDRPREDGAGGPRPHQVIIQQVHGITLRKTSVTVKQARAIHKESSGTRME